MMTFSQSLLLYFALLAGVGAFVSGEIAVAQLMFDEPSIELVEAQP